MPNLRGGKAYKKGKFANEDEKDMFIDKQPDQMIGRLVRLLGNRNTSVYCEDKITRVCRISTGCKKSIKFDVGDVVLLSLRDCEVSKAELAKGERSDRGDILAKYNPLQFAQLKKDGINLQIFGTMDTVNAMAMASTEGKEIDQIDAIANEAMDDFFEPSESEKPPTNLQKESDEIDIDTI